jgi:hypothetical protein
MPSIYHLHEIANQLPAFTAPTCTQDTDTATGRHAHDTMETPNKQKDETMTDDNAVSESTCSLRPRASLHIHSIPSPAQRLLSFAHRIQ